MVDVGADFPVPLTVGLPFTVSLQLLPAVQVQGQIREIAPQADPVTRMRRVRIALNDPPAELPAWKHRHGEAQQRSELSLRVPASAVLTKDGETFVWVVDLPRQHGFAAQGRPLRGRRQASGSPAVSPQETRIVTAGIHSLKPGQQVRIEQDTTP